MKALLGIFLVGLIISGVLIAQAGAYSVWAMYVWLAMVYLFLITRIIKVQGERDQIRDHCVFITAENQMLKAALLASGLDLDIERETLVIPPGIPRLVKN